MSTKANKLTPPSLQAKIEAINPEIERPTTGIISPKKAITDITKAKGIFNIESIINITIDIKKAIET